MSKSKKTNRWLSLLLVLVMLVGFVPVFETTADAADAIFKFTWDGVEYGINPGETGSGNGITWSSDALGNVTFTVTKQGATNLTVTKGSLNILGLNLTGGGAGGSAAAGGPAPYGVTGAGGGGGEIKAVSNIEGWSSRTNPTITVTVGAGGAGAVPQVSTGCGIDDWGNRFQCPVDGGYNYISGNAGGNTSVVGGGFSYVAQGGKPDQGGASVKGEGNGNPGTPATATRAAGGGSGASAAYWEDSGSIAGNFNYYSYTCFLCGLNYQANYLGYMNSWYQGAHWTYGGAGVNGSGSGGNPGNPHNCKDPKGMTRSIATNKGGDATAYGAGGGGGAFCSGIYTLGFHSHSGTGSTSNTYYVGAGGGAGKQGIAYVYAKIDLVTIAVTKYSDDSILSGHQFKVTNTATNEVYNIITDANGKADVQGLPFGTYTVEEVQSDAYLEREPAQTVTASSAGTYSVEFHNTAKKLNVTLTKTDAENVSDQGNGTIVGAEYTLYSYTGTQDNPQNITAISTRAITSIGEAEWKDLSLARTYFIQETKAAPGYQLDNQKHFVNFNPAATDDEENYIDIDVVDYVQRGVIQVTKKDSVISSAQGDATLAGTVFEIYNKSAKEVKVDGTVYAVDAKVQEITTNASGVAVSSQLPYGTYEVIEKTAPVGYINQSYTVTVDNFTNTTVNPTTGVEVKDDVKRASLTVTKEDIYTGQQPEGDTTLKDAKFTVTNASGSPISLNAEQRLTSDYVSYATPSTTTADGDYVYNAGALIATLTTMDDTGACETIELPYGSYKISETVTPVGYLADAADQTVSLHENDEVTDAQVTFKNTPKSTTVSVNKKDTETGENAQGDGTLSGMTFEIYNNSLYPIYYKGNIIPVGGLVEALTTDEHGDATSDPLPYGTYKVVETKAPNGYEVPISSYYEEGANHKENGEMQNITITMQDEVKRGDLRVMKFDSDTYDIMQGDATFEGTVFEVYNASDAYIYLSNAQKNTSSSLLVYASGTPFASGSTYAPGDLIATVTTGGAGDVIIPNLPYGRYRVVETVPPVGYYLNNSGDVYDVTIKNYDDNCVIIANVEAICEDTVKRGHWTITKIDDYTGAVAEGGATLAGAKFEVINKSAGPVWFVGGVKGADGTMATSLYQPDEVVQEILTDANGKVVTGDLPYGTYLIKEVNAPDGYLVGIGDGQEGDGFETEELKNYDASDIIENQNIDLKDSVKRGDFSFQKKNQAQEFLPFVVFRVTSDTTGESHIIVTDANGEFNSASVKYKHSDNTNANDAAVAADGTVDDSLLNPESGIWFTGLADTELEPNDNRGAMPYDVYTVEELRCDGNEGLELVTFKVTVAVGGYTIDNGIVTDLNPSTIHSVFIDTDTEKHYSTVGTNTTLVETVDLHSLVRGRTYTIKCTLVDKDTGDVAVDAQGNELVQSKTIIATATEMTGIKITFNFDSGNMKGATLVATDTLTYLKNFKTYTATVHDLTSMIGDELDEQTVTFPAIATTLRDDTGEKEVGANTDVTLVDEVQYMNLEVNKTYKISGTLMNKSTGEAITDASGKPYEASIVFKPTTPNGYVLVTFEHVDLSSVAGTSVVAFETLAFNNPYTVIYKHEDIEDEDQTITVPKIRTTAVNENQLKTIDAEADQTIIDTIAYENLLPNTEYKVETDVIDLTTGDSILSSIGESTFTSSATGNGTVDVTISNIDATELAGKTVVVFEKLIRDNTIGEPVIRATHEDDTDEEQFIYVPSVRTTAASEDGQKEVTIPTDITKTHVVDTVIIENAVVGETYRIEGKLYNKTTGEFITDENGDVLVVSTEFTATEADFDKDITFEFDATELVNGEALVAYEYLYEVAADATVKLVGTHEDADDEDQTVYVPNIRTKAQDETKKTNVFLAGETVTIIDTVSYKGLIPGTEYTMSGTLVSKTTGTPITDADGEKVTASVTFTATDSEGEVDVTFSFNAAEELEGSKAVAYEVLSKTVIDDNGDEQIIDIVKHEDKEDEEQTVAFPKVTSFAISESTEKMLPVDGEQKIIDEFEYSDFIDGASYVLRGTLYDADTQEKLLDADGNAITAEATVTAGDDWKLEYTIVSEDHIGKTIVCSTEVYDEFDRLVAVENDLTEEKEMVYLPKLATTAASVDTDGRTLPQLVKAGESVVFIDYVDYANLLVKDSDGNKLTYTVVGKLYDKDTDSFVVADGEVVTAMAILPKSGLFTKPSESGTVEVKFEALDITALAGHTLVVFENLYYGKYDSVDEIPDDKLVYSHEDKDDEGQTLYIPEIKTTLKSDKELNVVMAAGETTLVDTVEYKNLIEGEEYTLIAKLYNKEANKLTEFVGETTFTAATADGTVDVEFNGLDLTDYANKTFVCFEYLYVGTETNNDKDIRGEHTDKDDEAQTVHVPEIKTTATGADGEKVIEIDENTENVTIVDVVAYNNLSLDSTYEYVLTGTLMYVTDNAPVVGEDGKAITAKTVFTPTEANGTETVTFEVPAELVAGKKIVVYESLYCNEILIANHRDLTDEGQTVSVNTLGYISKIDGTTKEGMKDVTIVVKDKTTNTELGEFKTNEDGDVFFPAVPGHTYEFYETSTVAGYVLDSTHYTMTIDEEGNQTGSYLIVNWKMGTVVITKTDSITGAPIEGAKIAVYRNTGRKDATGKPVYETVFEQVTDIYGRIYFYPDRAGDYIFQEIEAPEGYYLDNEEFTFTVKPDMTATGTMSFTNSKIGTIVIKKFSNTGARLEGAVISIYNSVSGARLGTGKTDAYGRVYFVSPGAGTYYFIEEEAPKGYLRDRTPYNFTIAPNGTISGTTTLVNKPDPSPQTGDYLERNGWAIAAAVGTALTLGAVSVMIIRKRKSANDN